MWIPLHPHSIAILLASVIKPDGYIDKSVFAAVADGGSSVVRSILDFKERKTVTIDDFIKVVGTAKHRQVAY